MPRRVLGDCVATHGLDGPNSDADRLVGGRLGLFGLGFRVGRGSVRQGVGDGVQREEGALESSRADVDTDEVQQVVRRQLFDVFDGPCP